MSAKQGFSGNKIKRLCVFSLLCAVCLCLGYLESLLPLDFIAPGVKIGLANTVAVLLIFYEETKGAIAVNTARIILTALLFGSAVSLAFSLSAGLVSLSLAFIFSRVKAFSVVGVSIISALSHNLTQCAVAALLMGAGVIYYLPVLIISALVCGAVTGSICLLLFKKLKL